VNPLAETLASGLPGEQEPGGAMLVVDVEEVDDVELVDELADVDGPRGDLGWAAVATEVQPATRARTTRTRTHRRFPTSPF
jgi:hypothetical protein